MCYFKAYFTPDFKLSITVMYITKDRLQNINIKINVYLKVFANPTRILILSLFTLSLGSTTTAFASSHSSIQLVFTPHDQSTPFKLWNILKISDNLVGTQIYMPAKFYINRSSNKIHIDTVHMDRHCLLQKKPLLGSA